tara:strand:- start:5828 stop:6961 length:1134 start_codon:yes stop_codon:yes gene_type:complete
MRNISKYIQLEGDKTIWTVVISLLVTSILVVYSVEGLNSVRIHIRNIFLGLIVLYAVHKLKFKYFSKLSVVGLIISIILLLFVLFIGIEINGAKRWIYLGGLSFQPSDFAKVIILVFISRQISKYRNEINTLKGFCFHLILPLSIICLLIFPSNLSTAVLVFTNGFFLMVFGKIRPKYLFSILSLGLFLILVVYFSGKYIPSFQDSVPRSKTWVNRIDSFINPNDNYVSEGGHQLNESKIAIKNGGIFGKGPGKGIQRHFLYASSSDFVYAITIEQYGILFGGFLPMLLYLIFFYRCVIISNKTESVFGSLIVAGLSFSLLLQASINMAVNVGVLPVTGQTLPLISKGGTSIIFTCISIGIILSVSRNSLDRDYERA